MGPGWQGSGVASLQTAGEGAPLRDRIKVYAHGRGESVDELVSDARSKVAQGFLALKTGIRGGRAARIIETPGFVNRLVERIEAVREPLATRSTSPSTSTAQSARRPPVC